MGIRVTCVCVGVFRFTARVVGFNDCLNTSKHHLVSLPKFWNARDLERLESEVEEKKIRDEALYESTIKGKLKSVAD